jgi:hypothetical protein
MHTTAGSPALKAVGDATAISPLQPQSQEQQQQLSASDDSKHADHVYSPAVKAKAETAEIETAETETIENETVAGEKRGIAELQQGDCESGGVEDLLVPEVLRERFRAVQLEQHRLHQQRKRRQHVSLVHLIHDC